MYARTLILIAILLTCAACSPVAEVVVAGKIRDRNLLGDGPVAIFRLKQEINDHFACEYQHFSFWFEGPPFFDGHESSMDTLGCSFRTRLWGADP